MSAGVKCPTECAEPLAPLAEMAVVALSPNRGPSPKHPTNEISASLLNLHHLYLNHDLFILFSFLVGRIVA